MSLVLINTERFIVNLKHQYVEGRREGEGNYFWGKFEADVGLERLRKFNPPPATGEESELMRKVKTLIRTTPAFTNRVTIDLIITPMSESGSAMDLEIFVGGPLIDYLTQPTPESFKMMCQFFIQTEVNDDAVGISKEEYLYKPTSGPWKFGRKCSPRACEESSQHSQPRLFPREGVFHGGIKIVLKSVPPLPTTLLNRSIFENQTLCDYAIVAKSPQGDAVLVGCHKCQLEASSPFFQRVFMGEFGDKDGKGGDAFELCQNLSEAVVKAALSFIYYSNVDKLLTDKPFALKVLEFAYTLEFTLLYQFLRNEVLDWNFSSDELSVVLVLYIFSNGVCNDIELKGKAVEAFKRICPTEVKFTNTPEYKKMRDNNPCSVDGLIQVYRSPINNNRL